MSPRSSSDYLDFPRRGLGDAPVDLVSLDPPFPSAQPCHAFCRRFLNMWFGYPSFLMPAHPIEACYCHIIEAGLANIDRLNRSSAADHVANELEHLRAVIGILTAVLLYSPSDPRHDDSIHDRYWNEIRPLFITHADRESIRQFIDAWEFLALATRGTDFRDSLRNDNATGDA